MPLKPHRPCVALRKKLQGKAIPLKTDHSQVHEALRPRNGETTVSAATTAVECSSPSTATAASNPDPEARESSESNSIPLFSDNEEQEYCTTKLVHPFQSFKIHDMCPDCKRIRAERLSVVESGNEVKFEDWRWKVKYLSPVPEEARYTEWGIGGVGEWGETMGSWVKDFKGKGLGLSEGLMKAFRETGQELLSDELKKDGLRGEGGLGIGFRGGMPSS